MTAIATSPSVAPLPRRIANVVRLHVANPIPTLVMPWGITAVIFAINLAIWLMVANAAGGVQNLEEGAFQYNGGISWIVVFMMIVAIQCMSLTFSFAMGFSVTRRDYYLGTSAYFLSLSVLYATGLTALAAIEQATGGWGLDAAFFSPWGLSEQSYLTLWFVYFATMLMFFFIGASVATVWVRWKAYGLYAFFVGLALLLVGAGWLITATDSWGDVGQFFAGSTWASLAAWTLPVTVVCAVVGFLFLRKATPRG